jgi:hypothetical protein
MARGLSLWRVKTWGRAVVAAFWIAAVMSAAQVGVASVLGAVRLDAQYADADRWTAQTAFLAWFALVAVAVGTAAGARSTGLGTRLSAAFAAGIGSALGSGIALFPARHADIPSGDPALLAGIALGIGSVAGIVVAFGMLSARSLSWNAAAYGVLMWLFLAGAVAAEPADVQAHLGSLAGPGLPESFVHSFELWGLPVLAAVIGLVVALIARLRGHHRLAIAVSGASGPATVALAYVIVGPGSSDYQKIPWISALIAVATGLAAAVLVALPPKRTESDDPAFTSALPTADNPPLPSRREWKAETASQAATPTSPAPASTATPKAPRPTASDSVESWVSTLTPTADAGQSSGDRPYVPRPLG